jgi:hypothetical protein
VYVLGNQAYLKLLVSSAEIKYKQLLSKVRSRERAEAATNFKDALFGGLSSNYRMASPNAPLQLEEANQRINPSILEDEGETLERMRKQGSEGHFVSTVDMR